MMTPIWDSNKNETFVFYVSESQLLSKQPADLKLHKGFLKDDVFCLKFSRFTETALFIGELFEGGIPMTYNCIYMKRRGDRYEITASAMEIRADATLAQTIQPKELKRYRFWSVDYLSILFKWIHERKLVDSL